MLIAISALKGYALEASDGTLGTVRDFLFDDATWRIRWIVVETGRWLTQRKVLVHPSAIRHPDHEGRRLPVALTKAQVEASPPIGEDQPVSSQMESHLFAYYGSDPMWGAGYFGPGSLGAPFSSPLGVGASAGAASALMDDELTRGGGDPHLRSIDEIKEYGIKATDGVIGHVSNLLIDDGRWEIRYLIVDTRNWWPGKHVLISPYAVASISWIDREIRLDVDREQVRSSPPWDPIAMIDRVYEKQLHKHYGWAGYGF